MLVSTYLTLANLTLGYLSSVWCNRATLAQKVHAVILRHNFSFPTVGRNLTSRAANSFPTHHRFSSWSYRHETNSEERKLTAQAFYSYGGWMRVRPIVGVGWGEE